MSGQPEITMLLKSWQDGDHEALDQLSASVYEELKRLARSAFRSERPGHTLQPTALVNEAFMKLVDANVSWENRAHFFSAAAETMRRVLIDRARGKKASKRGGGRQRAEIELQDWVATGTSGELVALDEALQALEEQSQEKANVVKLRYFVGLSVEETAQALGVSTATVKRSWAYSKAWLRREMNRSD